MSKALSRILFACLVTLAVVLIVDRLVDEHITGYEPGRDRSRLSREDMEGVWRIDREVSRNTSGYVIPDSDYSFVLVLNTDNTFTAYNVPEGYFFDSISAGNYSGTWDFYDNKEAEARIKLTFTTLSNLTSGVWDVAVEQKKMKQVLRVGPDPSYILISRDY